MAIPVSRLYFLQLPPQINSSKQLKSKGLCTISTVEGETEWGRGSERRKGGRGGKGEGEEGGRWD